MTLAKLAELARQDVPPAPRSSVYEAARLRAEQVGASESRALVVACVVSMSIAAIVATAAVVSKPAPADPLEVLFVSFDGRTP
jgi:hypothetical protein